MKINEVVFFSGGLSFLEAYYNYRETEGCRLFQVKEAKLWNSIPLHIRKKDSTGSFKYSGSERIFF